MGVGRSCNRLHGRTDGFTLIELLVVVAIISILAVIALSNISRAFRSAREGRTFAHLDTLRTAVRVYGGTHLGMWPQSITDAAAPPPSNWGDLVNADFVEYIGDQLPIAEAGVPPFDDGSTDFSRGVWQTANTGDNPGGNYRGWHYCPTNGNVRINNSTNSLSGKPYSDY